MSLKEISMNVQVEEVVDQLTGRIKHHNIIVKLSAETEDEKVDGMVKEDHITRMKIEVGNVTIADENLDSVSCTLRGTFKADMKDRDYKVTGYVSSFISKKTRNTVEFVNIPMTPDFGSRAFPFAFTGKSPRNNNRALCVGINKYGGRINPLNGCINDATAMAELLKKHYDFPQENVAVLINEQATSLTIQTFLSDMIENANEGDSLVYYHSGHGTQLRSLNDMGEVDGMDEVLCTYDIEFIPEMMMLKDDVIYNICNRVKDGVSLTLIFDTCHSGDMSRDIYLTQKSIILPPAYLPNEEEVSKLHKMRNHGIKRLGARMEEEGRAVLMAACGEDESAQETVLNGLSRGAFTFFLNKALKEKKWKSTYIDAMERTTEMMKEWRWNLKQTPVLKGLASKMTSQIFKAKEPVKSKHEKAASSVSHR